MDRESLVIPVFFGWSIQIIEYNTLIYLSYVMLTFIFKVTRNPLLINPPFL